MYDLAANKAASESFINAVVDFHTAILNAQTVFRALEIVGATRNGAFAFRVSPLPNVNDYSHC